MLALTILLQSYLNELQSRSSNSELTRPGPNINVSTASAQRTVHISPAPSVTVRANENTHVGDGARHRAVGATLFGESTCTDFSQQVLQCLSPYSMQSPPGDYPFYRNPAFARQAKSLAACKLPDRIRAHLLVRVFLRFIGHDYHFFLERDFLSQLEKAYDVNAITASYDVDWACKFFVVLALGELYSTSATPNRESRDCRVPGVDYFVTATQLLQDLYEDPTISQIETLTLFVSLGTPLNTWSIFYNIDIYMRVYPVFLFQRSW
jgi:hypothetical protein